MKHSTDVLQVFHIRLDPDSEVTGIINGGGLDFDEKGFRYRWFSIKYLCHFTWIFVVYHLIRSIENIVFLCCLIEHCLETLGRRHGFKIIYNLFYSLIHNKPDFCLNIKKIIEENNFFPFISCHCKTNHIKCFEFIILRVHGKITNKNFKCIALNSLKQFSMWIEWAQNWPMLIIWYNA